LAAESEIQAGYGNYKVRGLEETFCLINFSSTLAASLDGSNYNNCRSNQLSANCTPRTTRSLAAARAEIQQNLNKLPESSAGFNCSKLTFSSGATRSVTLQSCTVTLLATKPN